MVGRTPLFERSACHKDLYLPTHNTHNRQTSMLLVGFKPTISTGERLQSCALDRTASGTNGFYYTIIITLLFMLLESTTIYAVNMVILVCHIDCLILAGMA
jgi:hypothetical protein